MADDERGLADGLVALPISVRGKHREAVLIFSGIYEVTNDGSRRIRSYGGRRPGFGCGCGNTQAPPGSTVTIVVGQADVGD